MSAWEMIHASELVWRIFEVIYTRSSTISKTKTNEHTRTCCWITRSCFCWEQEALPLARCVCSLTSFQSLSPGSGFHPSTVIILLFRLFDRAGASRKIDSIRYCPDLLPLFRQRNLAASPGILHSPLCTVQPAAMLAGFGVQQQQHQQLRRTHLHAGPARSQAAHVPHRPVPQGRKRRGVVAADSSVLIPAMPIPGKSCLGKAGFLLRQAGFLLPAAADSLTFIPQVLMRS